MLCELFEKLKNRASLSNRGKAGLSNKQSVIDKSSVIRINDNND